MSTQHINKDVRHASNQLYHEQDKTRKGGSKDKCQAIHYGREDKESETWYEWVLHLFGIWTDED